MGYRLILLMDNFDAVFQNQLLTPDAIDGLRPLTWRWNNAGRRHGAPLRPGRERRVAHSST